MTLPKYYRHIKTLPKKLNQAPYTIYYTENMKSFLKVKTVDTDKLQPGEFIHVDFPFYNVTYVFRFTSMITIVCEKNRMLGVFPTASKWDTVHIIRFILTTLKN